MWNNVFENEPLRNELTKEAITWAACNGFVVSSSMYASKSSNPWYASTSESSAKTFTHSPFTLLPSLKMSHSEYDHLCSLSFIYHKLIDAVARDSDFLMHCLSKTTQSDPDFLGKLVDIWQKVLKNGIKQPYYFGIFRNDFMKDTDEQNKWIQIEINTIASAGGLMSDLVTKLHRFLIRKLRKLTNTDLQYPLFNDNNEGLTYSLFKASELVHTKYQNGKYQNIETRTILMVVDDDEVNISDQRGLEYELLRKYDIYTLRRSLTYIYNNAIVRKDGEFYIDDCFISVIYFRAGYSPKHYPSDKEWKARQLIEESIAIKCPNIEYQLIGSKLMQIVFCDKNVLRKYLNDSEINSICAHFGQMSKCDDKMLDVIKKNPDKYVLKHTQREGGGNNLYNDEILDFVQNKMDKNEQNNWIAMKRIYPKSVKSVQIRNFNQVAIDAISEFGIYSSYICDDKGHVVCDEVIGTLVRTKPKNVSNGGVFSGFAVFDSVIVEGMDSSKDSTTNKDKNQALKWYFILATLVGFVARLVYELLSDRKL